VSSLGVCSACRKPIADGASFVDIGPTDSGDRHKPRRVHFVPVESDIHGWSPFETQHPECFAAHAGIERLVALVDESHRLMRGTLAG
jgi:hypothetical protein